MSSCVQGTVVTSLSLSEGLGCLLRPLTLSTSLPVAPVLIVLNRHGGLGRGGSGLTCRGRGRVRVRVRVRVGVRVRVRVTVRVRVRVGVRARHMGC